MSLGLQRVKKIKDVTRSVIQSVILNLFQDLKRSRVRRSRNEFGMTRRQDDRFEGIFE